MDHRIENNNVIPVRPGHPQRTPASPKTAGTPFSDLLRKEVGKGSEVRFSAHAQQRLASRRIELSGADRTSLAEAVDKAAAKGSKDSLILLRDLAFVVSVTNRTVVTALDKEAMRENVFTGIDSAVIVK